MSNQTGGSDRSTLVTAFGATGDGKTDDTAAIQAAIAALPEQGSLHFPAGTYIVSETIQFPGGRSYLGDSPASQLNRPTTVLKAAPGSNLTAVACTPEWATPGTRDTPGLVLYGLGVDGGADVRIPELGQAQGTIPTTSDAANGLIAHGCGVRLDSCAVYGVSGHGIWWPQHAADGTTVLSESHENMIVDCWVEATGGDGLRAEDGQQDTWVRNLRTAWHGGHAIDLLCGSGWSVVDSHPQKATGDLIHVGKAWETRIIGNYCGSVGLLANGQPHYGIYCAEGPAVIIGNSINENTKGAPTDPVAGIGLSGGPVLCRSNEFLGHAGANSVALSIVSKLTKTSITEAPMDIRRG